MVINYTLAKITEDLLGREVTVEDGILSETLERAESRLGVILPKALREFYCLVGMNDMFLNPFQHFIAVDMLSVDDGRLVFLDENQSVCHWGVSVKDTSADPAVLQIGDDGEVHSEKIGLGDFLKLMLYYQCAMGGYEFSGYSTECGEIVRNLESDWINVVKHNGLVIHWKASALIC